MPATTSTSTSSAANDGGLSWCLKQFAKICHSAPLCLHIVPDNVPHKHRQIDIVISIQFRVYVVVGMILVMVHFWQKICSHCATSAVCSVAVAVLSELSMCVPRIAFCLFAMLSCGKLLKLLVTRSYYCQHLLASLLVTRASLLVTRASLLVTRTLLVAHRL